MTPPLLTFLLTAYFANAASNSISGRVQGPQGLPVTGLTVEVADSSGRIVCTKITTDAGAWSCTEPIIPPARVTVSGRQWNQSIFKAEDTQKEVVVTLQPATLLQTVVVSGSRIEELQDDSAQRVEAVTRQQIQSTGYERVSDVLAEMPGVVTRRGSTATVAGEQVQGIDSRQVAVLQDGLPIPGARGVKSGVLNLHRQSTSGLQRVEVAKGAGSALYGSDAIGGVINLISREASHPIEAEMNVSGGTLGMFDLDGSLGGRIDKLSVLVSGGTHRMDGYKLVPSSVASVGPDWNRQDGAARLRWAAHQKFFLGLAASGYHNHEEAINLTEQGNATGVVNDSTQAYSATFDYIPSPAFDRSRATLPRAL